MTFITIARFPVAAGGLDGGEPSGIILDAHGNIFGVTIFGGAYNGGIAFEFIRNGSMWQESILHNFGSGQDGLEPFGTLVFDKSGNLYGTTQFGGGQGSCNVGTFVSTCGTIYRLTPSSGGTWTESVVYSFTGSGDGGIPWAGLVSDGEGNFYGTTTTRGDLSCQFGGGGCGTVYEFKP